MCTLFVILWLTQQFAKNFHTNLASTKIKKIHSSLFNVFLFVYYSTLLWNVLSYILREDRKEREQVVAYGYNVYSTAVQYAKVNPNQHQFLQSCEFNSLHIQPMYAPFFRSFCDFCFHHATYKYTHTHTHKTYKWWQKHAFIRWNFYKWTTGKFITKAKIIFLW